MGSRLHTPYGHIATIVNLPQRETVEDGSSQEKKIRTGQASVSEQVHALLAPRNEDSAPFEKEIIERERMETVEKTGFGD